MRLFLLSVAVFGLIGVGAAWAADDSVGTTSSGATQTATSDSSSTALGNEQLQRIGEAMDERALAKQAEERIAQKKCETFGKQYDSDLQKCVDDANVQYRYKRKWDPLFGDMPVPEPLFNNVR